MKAIIAASAMATVASIASAADGTWAGTGDGLWPSAGNWVDGSVPGNTSGAAGTSTDTAVFTGVPALRVVGVDANRNIRSILFENIVPDAGVQINHTIGDAGVNAGNPLYLSGGGFLRTAATVIGSGTTNMAVVHAPMVLTGTSFTFDCQSGSVTDSLPGIQLFGNITAGAGAPTTIIFDGVHGAAASSRCEIESSITDGPGGAIVSVVKNGPGTWEMNQGTLAANTYSGDTIINAGILRASDGADGLGGFSPNSHYIVNNTGLLRNSVVGTTVNKITINPGGAVNASSASATTMNVASTNGPSLHLNFPGGVGGGTVVMARLPLTLTGTVAGEGGVKLSADADTPAIRIGASNSNFDLGSVSRTFDVAKGNPLNSFDLRMDGFVIGGGANGGVVKTGLGTLRFANSANTFVGTVTINQGTLAGDVDNVFGSGNPLNINGGTLHVFGTAGTNVQTFGPVVATKGAITGGSTIASTVAAPSFTLNVAAGDTFSASAVLADSGGAATLIKTGAGVATLTANNSYTGGTVINGGVLSVNTNAEDVIRDGAGADLQKGKLIFDYTGGTSPAFGTQGIVNTILAPGFAGNFATGNVRSSTAISGVTGLGWNDDGVGNFTVAHVRYGDANLSGSVTLDDFTALASNFGNAGGWGQGDFNYSGTVNLDDFTALAANFGLSTPLARSAVPEPTAMGAIALCTTALLRRRRHA